MTNSITTTITTTTSGSGSDGSDDSNSGTGKIQHAALIIIGDEILNGFTTDVNLQVTTKALASIGENEEWCMMMMVVMIMMTITLMVMYDDDSDDDNDRYVNDDYCLADNDFNYNVGQDYVPLYHIILYNWYCNISTLSIIHHILSSSFIHLL